MGTDGGQAAQAALPGGQATSESFWGRLAKTPASELSPGDQGIGLVDMDNGQPSGWR